MTKRSAAAALAAASAAGLALAASVLAADPVKDFTVTAARRVGVPQEFEVKTPAGATEKRTETVYVKTEFTQTIDPAKTAVVVCDMWDDHWCQSAAKRCDVLAKQAEPVLKAARAKGVTVVHAPSDCMAFYADHPARKRTLATPKAETPKPKDLPNPPLPIDDKDGGCDDDPPAKFRKAWTRQHAAITIDPDRDYISDKGDEVYAVMKAKGIDTLLVMGVHTNMCVLNRSFAIKQMVRWGVSTFLVRDITDAMYNPKSKPNVTHADGTRLVVEYIEAHWCPTFESRQLLK